MGKSLIIIGKGPEEKRLKGMANSNVKFMGWQPDETVAKYYSKCQALIFPGEEDFGIVPLEAMASGRPVIAYGRGGVLETVVPFKPTNEENHCTCTGVFFYEQNAESLIEAVKALELRQGYFDAQRLREHAQRWDRSIFKDKMRRYLEDILKVDLGSLNC
jgi:glycosyltransferase involved in cell wall biosynthesis